MTVLIYIMTDNKQLSVAVSKRGDDICVECTFLDDLVSSCVVVIHPTYKYLRSPHELLNINVSSLQNKASSNTISDCIQHLNASSVDYHIAAFAVSNSNTIGGHPVKTLSVTGT